MPQIAATQFEPGRQGGGRGGQGGRERRTEGGREGGGGRRGGGKEEEEEGGALPCNISHSTLKYRWKNFLDKHWQQTKALCVVTKWGPGSFLKIISVRNVVTKGGRGDGQDATVKAES